MTAFSVQPPALRLLAQMVDRAREDVEATHAHLAQMQEFEGGEGVIGRLTGGYRDVYQALDEWLRKLANPTLTSVVQAINDSAAYYERTDHASAEDLDSTYPAADVAGQRKQTGYSTDDTSPPEFKDIAVPRGRLNNIRDYSDEMRSDYDWWDTFSPMTWIAASVEAVSHVASWIGALPRPINPWDEIVKPWVGDWAGLRAAGDVLNNVFWAIADIESNLRWASQGCQVVWQGNAGDGAAVYLMKLCEPLDSVLKPINQLAAQYRVASEEMVKMRGAVVNVLKSIGDAAIEAAASGAVAGGTSSTGFGLPVGILAGVYSAYNVYRVAEGIEDIFGIIGDIDMIIKGIEAMQTDFGSLHHADTKMPSLPDTPLNTPR